MAYALPITTESEKQVPLAKEGTPTSQVTSQPLLSKTLEQLSVHLKTVVPAGDTSSDTPSLQELQDLLYTVFEKLNIDMGNVATSQAKLQTAQAKVSQAISKTMDKKTHDFMDALQDAEDAANSFWGKLASALGTVFGGVGGSIIMGIVGLLLVETGIGAAILAATVALSASGLLQKGTDALADQMGGSLGAKIGISLAVTAILTGGTGLAEGLSIGARAAEEEAANLIETVSQSAARAGEETASNAAASASEQAAAASSEEAAASAAENSAASGADQSSEQASQATAKTKPRSVPWGFATAQVFTTTLFTLNPAYNIAKAFGASDETATYVSMGVNIALSLAAFAGAASGQTFTNISQIVGNKSLLLKTVIQGTMLGSTLGQTAYGISTGLVQIDTASAYDTMAPLQGDLSTLKGVTSVNNNMSAISQKVYTAVMTSIANAFQINFANEWQAVAQATVEIAG